VKRCLAMIYTLSGPLSDDSIRVAIRMLSSGGATSAKDAN
jgi:hypothetical protein